MASDRKILEKLRELVNGDPFAGPFWPLSLELTHLGAGDPDWEKADTLAPLRTLHKAKVSIIDWRALPKVFLFPAPRDEDDEGPDYAIEDFGSDYEDDEDEDEEDEDNEEDEQSF